MKFTTIIERWIGRFKLDNSSGLCAAFLNSTSVQFICLIIECVTFSSKKSNQNSRPIKGCCSQAVTHTHMIGHSQPATYDAAIGRKIRFNKIRARSFIILIFWLLLFTTTAHASKGIILTVEKIFEQEIEVPVGTTIKTRGPGSPNLNIHGTVTSTSERGAFTLKGKGSELVLKIDRRFHIFTWKKNIVKHKVVIIIEADDAKMEKEILDALTMNLQIGADRSLEIDCFLGIHRIEMRNGWFKSNDNTLITKSGKEVKFRSLSISSILTIPESSNLDLDAKYMEVTLGKLDGTAKLNLEGTLFSANYIGEVEGKFNASEVSISEVKRGSISAHNSEVIMMKAEDLEIGKLKLDNTNWLMSEFPYMPTMQKMPKMVPMGSEITFTNKADQYENKYSSSCKYTVNYAGKLSVYSSVNDHFSINEVAELKLMDVAFSEFDISMLQRKISGTFDFGELNIYGFDQKLFENIFLSTSYGSLRFIGENSENLKIVVKNNSNQEGYFLKGEEVILNDKVFQISPKYKMTASENNTEFIYERGNYKENENQKGLIHITCDFCDLILN